MSHPSGVGGPIWLDRMRLIAVDAAPPHHVPTPDIGLAVAGYVAPPRFSQGMALEWTMSTAKGALLWHGVFAHEASSFQNGLDVPIVLADVCMNSDYPPCKTPAWRWRLGG